MRTVGQERWCRGGPLQAPPLKQQRSQVLDGWPQPQLRLAFLNSLIVRISADTLPLLGDEAGEKVGGKITNRRGFSKCGRGAPSSLRLGPPTAQPVLPFLCSGSSERLLSEPWGRGSESFLGSLPPSFPSFPLPWEHLIPGALQDPTEDTCFCRPCRIQRVGLSWTSIAGVPPLPVSTLPPETAVELGALTWQLAGSTRRSCLYNFS